MTEEEEKANAKLMALLLEKKGQQFGQASSAVIDYLKSLAVDDKKRPTGNITIGIRG